ncbi:gliding motility-associated C-terminal domain-containing protein [Cryomorpha ignava]|uniref:Gliding motility-associated C-terminal domain-containing protein n=2 Tax=Cryomorpha ignava TaxID=101383 RepID=A0A7K3WMV7_9FLAO|nr:gliding motility-associated C-terminal domain-containing protein [Cryomorpha ignava]
MANNASAQDTLSWTSSPSPINGAYEPGSIVTFCFTVEINPLIGGANWFHGLVLNIPTGWDYTSITNTSAPPSCTGSGGGNWAFYQNGPDGPGFYYDSGTGGPLDGNPGNNWGDPCSTNQLPDDFTFCFDITVGSPHYDVNGFLDGYDCGPGGNDIDGSSITPSVTFTGDGETGSWGGTYAPTPPVSSDPITIKCCDAEAGVSPGTLPICETGNWNLFDELGDTFDGIPPDTGGVWTYEGEPAYSWTNPWSPADSTWLGTFDPTIDPPGEYTYTVTLIDTVTADTCTSATTIIMEFISLGTVQNIADCSGTPTNILPLITNFIIPAGGTWTDPVGTPLVGATVDPNVNPPGLYTYSYYDAGMCLTTLQVQVTFATGGAAGSPGTVDICTSDAGCFSPFTALQGNPTAGGNWIVYDSTGFIFLDYLPEWNICLDMSTYPSTVPNGYVGDFLFKYLLGAPPCDPVLVDVTVNIFAPVNTGANTVTSLCVTDAPVELHTLVGGDPGLEWNQGGTVIPDLLDPSTYAANTSLSLYYEGGLAGTSCVSSTLLQLTILPTYAYAGENNTINVCTADAFILMRDSIPDNGTDVVQNGGTWQDNAGNPTNTDYFVPGTSAPGTYVFTYNIVSPCATDQSTLTIIVEPTLNPGTSGILDICSNETNVALSGGLTGTFDTGGTWTDASGIVVPGGTVNGNAVTNGAVYTYTVGSALCAQTATVTINVIPAPNAGVLTTTPQTYCDSDAPIDLMTLFTTPPSVLPSPGVAGWTNPGGATVTTVNPSSGSSASGVYTYTIQNSGCGQASVSITITINDTPNAGTDGTLTVCPNGTGTVDLINSLGGSPAPGGTWTGPFGGGFSGSFNPATPDAAGVYTYTVGTTCTDQATVTVSYDVLPNPGISSTVTVCAGDPAFNLIDELGTGAVLGNWSFGGSDTSGTFTPGTSSPGVYTNTVTAGTCPSVTATLTVNVTALPNAGADATVTFCETAGIVDLTSYLNGTPTTGGSWADAGGMTVSNSLNVATLCGSSLVYTYTVGSGTCSSSAVLSFDVICSPSAGSGGTLDLCSDNGSFSLFDGLTGPYDTPGVWTNSINTVVSNPTNMNPATLGTGDTFTYTVEALPCAAASADVVVSITPEITTANLDVSCTSSQTTYIVGFSISGGDGSYSNSGTTSGSISGGIFTSDPINVGTDYSLIISDGSACGDITVSGVSPNCSCPTTASFASGNETICIGSSTDIEMNLGGGIDGNYGFVYNDGTDDIMVSNASNGHIISVTPTVTTTYTLVSVTDGFCTNPISGSVTITVDPLNDAGNDVPQDYCGNGSNLVLTPATGEPTGGTFSPASIALLPANSGDYNYTMSGGQCPPDVAVYTINIDAPLATTSVQTTCESNQTEYTVTIVITGGTSPYSVDGNEIAGNSFTSSVIAMGTNYSFDIDDSGACGQITASGLSPNCNCPVNASFSTGNQTICIGSSTSIGLNLTGGIDGDYTVSYTAGGSPQSLSGLSDGAVITVSPTTTTTYTLTGVEDSNCPGSVNGSVTITVEQWPNAGGDISAEYCADGTVLVLTPASGQPSGGSFSPASVTKDVANSGVFTYTMSGNVCPDDQANYTIDFIQELEVIDLTAVCSSNQLEYTVSYTIYGGTPPYIINGGSPIYSTNFSEVKVFASNPTYNYTISDNGPCADVVISETAPDCNCIAEGSITGSQAICNGDGAEITFNGIGDAPFNITYTNSVSTQTTPLNSINNGHVITVYPTVTTTYTLETVSDSYCEGVVSGNSVTITVDNPVVISGVTEICNTTAEGYVVEFSYTGGVGPFTFSPGNTSSTPGVYTSPVYQSGSGYSITVNDAGACPQQIVSSPGYTCACLSDAGTIPTPDFEVCYGESATVTTNNSNLDGNDVLQYILHDGDGSSIGNVIATSTNGTFVFNYGSMTPGAAYYITAAVGNNIGGGNVNLNGSCTSLSNAVQVVMNPLPTASITGGSIVCVGEAVDLEITFTGGAPYDFVYKIDGATQGSNTIPTGNTFTLTVSQPGNYTLESVSNTCTGTVSGSAIVQNYETPTATLSGEPTVCEGSGDGPQVALTGNGPWNLVYTIDGVEQPPVTTNFVTYTIPVETDGNYALVSVEGSYCSGTVSGSQNVTILDAPTASITGGGTVCAGDSATFDVSLSGISPWTVQYTVDGVPQNPLTGITSGYSFESSVDGDYVLVSVTDANCSGEVLASQAALIVNPLPTAEVTTNKSSVCIGEELQLGIDLEGVPPYSVTYVLNGDTIVATGLYSDFMKTLSPVNPVTFEVIYVSDGSNPTCSSDVIDLTYIDAVALPNAPVLTDDTICATNGPVTIGVNAAPGLTYSWSPETSLSSPNTSNTLFQPFLSGPVAKDFKYVLTATNGECSARDTMIVTVDPGPQARFSYTPDPISSEDPTVFFKNNTVGRDNVIYFWEFDSLDTSNDFEPSYKFPDGINDSYTVSLTAIDPVTGCVDDYKDILKIKPEMLIYVPSAFTPDGDGKNDLWAPVLTNVDADNFKLTVYDRLGVLVFTTTDVKQKWNGNKMNGNYYVEPGVYVWMIETKNQVSLEEVNMKGIVTVVR